jgi:hypothetical protein
MNKLLQKIWANIIKKLNILEMSKWT